MSSAYYPKSNGRAEVVVKSAKRLLLSKIDASGSLNGEEFLKAMLQIKNTPDYHCSLSLDEIIYGHPLKDNFASSPRSRKASQKFGLEWYSNESVAF